MTTIENIDNNELSTPYQNIELASVVSLKPNQLNNNLYINLKENLSDKVLNKCCKYGYVTKIYDIIEYSDGIIRPEDFTGNVFYNLLYNAEICKPINNTYIVVKIINLTSIFIVAQNGPIVSVIKIKEFNDNNFKLNNKNEIIHGDKKLEVNDHIVIKIYNSKFIFNDKRITAISFLDRMATDKEVNLFYREN